MREDIKSLMQFIDATEAKNRKCRKRTSVEIKYSFFGGTFEMHVSPRNIVFGNDYVTIENNLRSPSEFILNLDITDDVKISIDDNAKTFVITKTGVTGILNKRIEGKLTREGRL